MTTKSLIIGETRHFDLFPKDNSTLEGLVAHWELHSLQDVTLTGVVHSNLEKTKFIVTVPTDTLKERLYELRVFVAYPDNSLKVCVYKEKLDLKS